MRRGYLSTEKNGFYGCYYRNPYTCRRAVILMLGDRVDDTMLKMGVKWFHKHGFNVLAMAPETKDYSFVNYKIEYFERALKFLRWQKNEKFGICGASTTGMAALAAASFIPDITLTVAISPCDFIMEGFLRDGLDGATERPANGESSLSYRGKPLAYLPYAYRHPEYWQEIRRESKRRGDMIASRDMFDESEKRTPVTEDMKIKVENIKGRIVFVGAEDDALWDTCRYIRRMTARLDKTPHDSEYTALIYEHGTHLMFPQSMLETIMPFGSEQVLKLAFRALREYPKECTETRKDLDKKLSDIIADF